MAGLKHIALILLLVALAPFSGSAQDRNAIDVEEILNHLRDRFNRIQDYQVDLQVSLDMPMLRMPRKNMTFSFKQPDLTRLEARGFAMVPRRGLALSPDSLLQSLHDLELAGDTLIDGHLCAILQGREQGLDDLDLQARLFVDRNLWLLRGLSTYLDDEEIFRLRTEYQEVAPDIYMPSLTQLRFQVNERFLRGRRFRNEHFDPDIPEPVLPEGQDLTGEAAITFNNYRINLGLPDSYFQEDTQVEE
ncbi:MAG: hypothetical protein JSU61_03435 [Fidelibacterota bacterium]|nr:MAG: hypothetical protein JSU61_03435 [Candidatus Neomarinimicrobiota bacterium]